jgi:hypothetical protein
MQHLDLDRFYTMLRCTMMAWHKAGVHFREPLIFLFGPFSDTTVGYCESTAVMILWQPGMWILSTFAAGLTWR